MTVTDAGVPSGFVGRAGELETLERALAAARLGSSGLLLLAGEGGLGKTRLLEEFARRSGLHRDRILWGRSPEQRGVPALWPWSQALGALVDALDEDELRALLGSAAAHVAHVVPPVCQRLGLERPAEAAGGDDNRFRIFGGVARFLARAAEHEPIVLLFDDLHFADGASLALLDFLTQELRDARVLLIGAYRPRELRRAEPIGWVARAREHVELRGFDRAEVALFLQARAGVVASEGVVARLFAASEGHPFFLDEMVRVLKSGGELSSDREPEVHGRLPAGVRAAIRQRLVPLRDDTRQTLELAAVLGRSFSSGALGLACAAPAATILAHLSDAAAHGIVEETADAPSSFRFTHALIREAVYGDLLPAARAAAHRRVALALEQHATASAEPPLVELAHHFYLSAALGDAPKAADYCARAAQRAFALGAHEESVAHYQRALQALAMQGPGDARELELRLALGLSLWRAGNERQARETFARAADAARASGDAVALARAALGFSTTAGLTGARDDEPAALLEEALGGLGAGDAPLRSLLLAALSMRLCFTAERAREKDLAADALAMAERLGDPGALAMSLVAQHVAHWEPDGLARRREIAARIVAAGDASGPAVALEGRMWRIVDALEEGDLVTVDVELEVLERRAQEDGLARWVSQAAFVRGMRALLAGRFDEAAALGARGLAVRPVEDHNNAAQFHLVQCFAARRDRGGLAALEAEVAAMAVKHTALPVWRAGLALLLAETGRAREAQVILERFLPRGRLELERDPSFLPALALLAEVASLVGDGARAGLIADALAPYADRMVVMGTAIACHGSVARHLGLATAAAGRSEQAERLLEQALDANERLAAPALVARTRRDLAALLLDRGDPRSAARAARLLDEARALARAYGLAALEESLARLEPAPAQPMAAATSAPRDGHDTATLRREGDYWTVTHGSTQFRLKHTKGLDQLATLLRHPGRELHVLDLAAVGTAEAEPAGTADEGLRIAGDPGDAGELLDARARSAYRARLGALREELDEARAFNDPERAARAEHELEFLADELARGVGLGGRSRKAASAAERARQNASRTISAVIRRIAAESPVLGQYLTATVHTGTFCSYDPDPRAPIAWVL